MQSFIERNTAALLATLRELCAIPAPTGAESARAAYCKRFLEGCGARNVYVDGAGNVIFPLGCEGSRAITVISAHTDTVFPDTEPMPFAEKDGRLYAPGVGDNTAGVAVLLYTAKYFLEQNLTPEGGVLFVCNTCEEGLGNLRGMRRLFADYEGRISRLLAFDCYFSTVFRRAVGSHRYEVSVTTEGGHSFFDYGKENAIAVLAALVGELYAIAPPTRAGSKSTLNVGKIEGGTSVNTIAESASMLCEYRSDDAVCLSELERRFTAVFDAARARGIALSVRRIGERPGTGAVDERALAAMAQTCAAIVEEETGVRPTLESGSTDCNIPLSLGIPAVCVGVYQGGGMHTREEWITRDSLPLGLAVGIRTARAVTEVAE